MGIPSALRNLIWCTYIGEEQRKGLCLCCNTEQITTYNHECGHIVAQVNGGESSLENLRPICSSCNKSMGTKNMDDFIKLLGIKRHPNWYGIIIPETKINDNGLNDCDIGDDSKNNNDNIKDNNVIKEDTDNKPEDIEQANIINRLAILKTNKIGPFVCEICKESFRKKSYLVAHIKRKIPCMFAKNFTCEYCNYVFSTVNSLKRHLGRECKMDPIILGKKLIEKNNVLTKKLDDNTKELNELKNKYPKIKWENI